MALYLQDTDSPARFLISAVLKSPFFSLGLEPVQTSVFKGEPFHPNSQHKGL